MAILKTSEKEFLDVFIHEATTSPFNGPATKALHSIGVEYSDISFINWAYNREAPPSIEGWGHAADVSPPVPWPDRESALKRDREIKRIWEQQREAAHAVSR